MYLVDTISNSLPSSPYGYGTLKGLEHSKNPELARVSIASFNFSINSIFNYTLFPSKFLKKKKLVKCF